MPFKQCVANYKTNRLLFEIKKNWEQKKQYTQHKLMPNVKTERERERNTRIETKGISNKVYALRTAIFIFR